MATATKKQSKIRLQPWASESSSKSRVKGHCRRIVLPDSARASQRYRRCCWHGRLLDGSRAESQLNNGDVVLFSSYAGEQVEIDDVEYLLMREVDVLAVVG